MGKGARAAAQESRMASSFSLRVAGMNLLALLLLSGVSRAQNLPTFSFSPAGTPYTLVRKAPDVSFAFTVDSSVETKVRLQWTPFVDEQGTPAETKLFVNRQPADETKDYPIAASGHLPVEIRARLTTPGTYNAYLTLSAGNQAGKPVALTVNRPKPTLQLFDIPALRFPAVGTLSAQVPLRINETSGQQVEVSPPQLTAFSVREGNDKFGAKVKASVVDEAGDAQTKLDLSEAAVKQLRLKLEGIEGPGQYEGTVRLTAPDGTFTEKTFSLYLREPRRVAFLFIFAGVLISFLLREYLTKSRPRLVEEVQALDLLAKLDGIPAPANLAERNLLSSLRQRIESVLDRLELPDPPLAEASTALDLLSKKVELAPLWIDLHRDAANITDPSARQTIESALEANRSAILLATTLAEAQAAESKLNTIAGQIAAATQTTEAVAAKRQATPTPAQRRENVLRRIKWSDVLVSAVVLLIATVLGLTSVWAKDPAWGGWEDRLVASLWGLGLDQFAFSGLKGLVSKLTA
jgi:hypothetical protein